MAKLEVEIGAEIKDLQSKVNQASKTLDKFGTKADKNLKGLNNSAKTAAKGMNNLNKGAANGSSAMLAFSRTVQDAPFGLMGVSNNITNLTEQFGYLKKRTGSARGALVAMLKDLKGFGGITLLISLATSAWLMYGDKIMSASKSVNDLVDAQKGLIGSARAEIKTTESLIKIAKDENKSKAERNRALTKAKELTDGYLESVNLENISSEKSTKLVNKYSEALLRQAKIKGLSSRISELYSKRYETESKTITENIGFVESLWTLTKNLGNTEKAAAEGVIRANKNKQDSFKSIDKQINKLVGSYDELISKDNELEGIFTKSKGTKDKKLKLGLDFGEAGDYDYMFQNVSTILADGIMGVQNVVNQNPIPILDTTLRRFDTDSMIMKEKLKQLGEGITQIADGGLKTAFMSIGNAIGSAMSGAGNLASNLGSALLGTLGGVLTQLGVMAITIGISLKAIKTALKTLNPLAAIGAGIGLIALGSYFSNKSASIGNSFGGSGGSSSGGSNAGTSTSFGGNNSRQNNQSLSGGFNGNSNVVFRIKGRDLIGVLSNELGRNRSLGGNLAIT